jgi:uncharacterized membrane protein
MTTDERGTVTVFVVVFMTALLAVAGLVIDGGNVLAARRQAANVAESAARAGAQVIDDNAVRATGEVHVDPNAARRRAEQYLTTTGYDGTVTIDGDLVVVEVAVKQRLYILGFGGRTETTVMGRGTAHGVLGITDVAEPA